ncbi:MAG: FAD-binding oxidoreductase [Gemmatimonadaceae bacterium]
MSTEQAVAAIRDGAALRISGRGGWLDAGRPVAATRTLSLAHDSGIVSYVPGDLTLTVRAGTTLGEIASVTREQNQWLPLDPYGAAYGTIGATVATASAGPLSSTFGLPRDMLLGIEFVNGRGEVIRAGGRVVKNVAGFDLTRLVTGSWGTLGVITEVTLRLYAAPQADRTFAIELGGTPREIAPVIRAIITSPLMPFAFQLVSRSITRALGLGESPVALLRFGGNESVVNAQISALKRITSPRELETGVWASLRELDADTDTAIRISSLPQRVSGTSATVLNDDLPGIFTNIDPRRGVMRILAAVPSAESDKSVETPATVSFYAAATGSGSMNGFSAEATESTSVIYEKLPPDAWASVSPSVVNDSLSRGIRKAFDPRNILNPGILGD